ncbi:MAG: LemA family protein [Candidatus Omnitrophota bacterium]
MVIVWLLIALCAAAVLWFFAAYNSLVGLKVRVDNAWSQIDVQLKRRYDLIPNLVESVKGYMAHEKDTLERVIKARSQAIDASSMADKSKAENFLTQTLRSLFAVVERYPDIKANQNVLKLQEELTSTENKISFARQYYNDEVGRYNTQIQLVPMNFVAQTTGFTKRDFFQIENKAEKEAPRVKF